MPSSTDSAGDRTVRWDLSTAEDPVAGGVLLAGIGLIAGVIVGPLLAGLVILVVAAALSGDVVPIAATAAVVAVALAVNRAQFAAIRAIGDVSAGYAFGRTGLALALVGGGVVHVVGFVIVDARWVSGVLVGVGLMLFVVAGALAGRGEVDPDAGTIEYVNGELPVESIRSVTPFVLGDRVVVLLRYHAGEPNASRLPTFSRAAFDAAEPLLRPADPPADGEGDAAPVAVRATAAAFGVGLVAVGAGAFLLAPPDARPAVSVLALIAGFFAATFGWYAYAG
ncbi:hypothetical protein [Halobaculum lipolyticum]|uniref:Membrane transporter protein n=1 Tax=Halobaculum lipolyticum TaxID=3032001 RepID=A0ABD5W4I3_9EURY|nr:hypothetical protein [Halobaculum sp. DT31]